MFTLNLKNNFSNYPKYLIINKHGIICTYNYSYFHYLIGKHIEFSSNTKGIFPQYLSSIFLTIDLITNKNKFKLDKLGTDYVVNIINMHYKCECIGSYPDNYVFVNEPGWPYNNEDRTDRGPLKRTYHWEEL